MTDPLEPVRRKMEENSIEKNFKTAIALGLEVLKKSKVSSEYGAYWEIRDLIQRIYRKGLQDNHEWNKRIDEDLRDINAIVMDNRHDIPAELAGIYANIVRDQFECLVENNQNYSAAEALEKGADLLSRQAEPGLKALLMYKDSAEIYVELSKIKEAFELARKAIQCFALVFELTREDYEEVAHLYARPFCLILGKKLDDILPLSLATFRKLADPENSATCHGRALRNVERIATQYPHDVYHRAAELASQVLEDLEEHPQHETLYKMNRQEVKRLQRDFLKKKK